jgi:hypothetical protein
MTYPHEILCPTYVDCPLCQIKRNENNLKRIMNQFDVENDLQIIVKHFYHLTVSISPRRETYRDFTLETIRKVGRDLINGLSSISSVSNRSWWSMFVEGGVRYYSVKQENEDDYPIFKVHFIIFSSKDNLDVRMSKQLKYRLKKINKEFDFSINYLGNFNDKIIKNVIELDISLHYGSTPLNKLGEDVLLEIYKLKHQKPIFFGSKYKLNKTNKSLQTSY